MRHTRIFGFAAALLFFIALPMVLGWGVGTMEKELRYTPGQLAGLKYYIVKGETDTVTLSFDFDGDLAPYAKVRANNYWYSTRLDGLNTYLQREFNLTDVSSATLKFYTKYDIEYGWDFGYVEVSVNNGSSWSQLSGTGTTTFRDAGAYVGVPGAPAYTGTVADWTLETIDLTAFTGGVVLFRFRYVTDDYYSENGWRIDDISVSEIGFSDDFESGSAGWVTDGWIDGVIYINDSAKTVPVYLDFIIPSDYSGNGSVNKVLISQVAGLEQGFNSAQRSVSTVVLDLPSLFRVVPPVETGGGSGSSSENVGGSYTYGDGTLSYESGRLKEFISNIVRFGMESAVDSIDLRMNRSVPGARIRIKTLDSRPLWIKQNPGDVFAYFEFNTADLDRSALTKVKIKFRVSKEWLDSSGKESEDMVLSRYHEGIWEDLPTVLLSESKSNFFYEAESPGFSVFAVRISSPLTTSLLDAMPTPKPRAEDIRPLTVVSGNRSMDEVVAEINDTLKMKVQIEKEGAETGAVQERPASVLLDEQHSVGYSRVFVWLALIGILISAVIALTQRQKHA